MKKIFLAILLICSIIKVQSQDDEKNLQTRKVSGFHGVEVSGGIDLYLSSGPESVSVSASSQTVRDHMITEVVDGVLRIHLEKNWHPGFGNSKMRAYVSVTDLRNLGASGGGEIILKNQITAGDLDISLSGGSNLKGKLNANHLVISQSGGSDVDITGTVQKLDVDASGGSDLAGFGLVTDFLHLSASGGSDTKITVNKELSIDASGGSDVTYKGTAVVKQIKSSGSSSVTHKD
jgi:Putative auto-transporter adhesin, head GIN domain